MGTAAQRNRLHGRLSTTGIRLDVVELQETSFPALPFGADERALALVPRPDRTADRRRNVARAVARRAAGAWAVGGGQRRSLQMHQKPRQRMVDDRGRIAVRKRVSHQILRTSQLLDGLRAHRDLDLVTLRGQRLDH
jgi:hypothetical protein